MPICNTAVLHGSAFSSDKRNRGSASLLAGVVSNRIGPLNMTYRMGEILGNKART